MRACVVFVRMNAHVRVSIHVRVRVRVRVHVRVRALVSALARQFSCVCARPQSPSPS